MPLGVQTEARQALQEKHQRINLIALMHTAGHKVGSRWVRSSCLLCFSHALPRMCWLQGPGRGGAHSSPAPLQHTDWMRLFRLNPNPNLFYLENIMIQA